MRPVGEWCKQSSKTLLYGKRYESMRFARHYDAWKAYEDHAGNLMRTLAQVIPWKDAAAAVRLHSV
jgi:hypothetical protein